MLRSSGVRADIRFDPQIYEADLTSLLGVKQNLNAHLQTLHNYCVSENEDDC
jgi:hypothetical protein